MRMNSGPYKNGDDWTGYFLRGDEALALAALMRKMAELLTAQGGKLQENTALLLNDIAEKFEQCDERKKA